MGWENMCSKTMNDYDDDIDFDNNEAKDYRALIITYRNIITILKTYSSNLDLILNKHQGPG